MEYELKRTADYIMVKMGEEEMKCYLGDLAFMRKMDGLMKRIAGAKPEDAGGIVAEVLRMVFGAGNIAKIQAFYGANEEEMMQNLSEFLTGCYIPAMAEAVRKESRRRAGLDEQGEGS